MNLEDVFFEEDDRVEPYRINEIMQRKYIDLLTMLAGLKAKGILDYEYTRPDQNYAHHTIYVTWKADEKEFVSVKKETMISILALFRDMDSFAFAEDEWNVWQFMCVIYEPKGK